MKFLTNYSKQAFSWTIFTQYFFLKGLYDFRDFRRYQKRNNGQVTKKCSGFKSRI